MSIIIIPTTQNIELEYPVASLGDRVLATMIDLLVQGGYLLILYLIIDWTDFELDTVTGIFFFLPVLFYHLVSEIFMDGQSLGKRVLKTRVIRLDGTPPVLMDYLLRWMLRIVDFFPAFYGAIGMLTVAMSKQGQRLGDHVAGTTVIKLKLVTHFADTIFVDTAEDYSVQFPQIQALSDRDVSILKEVLDAGLRSNNPALLTKLSNKIKEVAQIESQIDDKEFLQVILKDYNHLFGRNR